MIEEADRRIRSALDATARAMAPHWWEPDADRLWMDRLWAARRAPAGRAGGRLFGALAVALAAVLAALGIRHAVPVPRATPSAVPPAELLLSETEALFNQTLAPTAVSIAEPAPGTATVTNLGQGRWKVVIFTHTGASWVPTTVDTVVAGLPVTYDVVPSSTTPGVLLSPATEERLASRLAALPYSPQDTQAGALARLPINLTGARPESALGQPKVVLGLGSQTILALTYTATTPLGRTIYVPTGWYWWSGAPAFLRSPSDSGAAQSSGAP